MKLEDLKIYQDALNDLERFKGTDKEEYFKGLVCGMEIMGHMRDWMLRNGKEEVPVNKG